jgi:hypothetical protein
MASDHAPAAYVEATTTRDVPVIMTHENQLPFPLRSAPPSSACRARGNGRRHRVSVSLQSSAAGLPEVIALRSWMVMPTATAAVGCPREEAGAAQAALHQLGVTSPDLLQRAADIDRASEQLIIEAASRP